MADPTQSDVDEARLADLHGTTLVKHGDKTVQYDAASRAAAIERAQRRISKRPTCGLASPSKGY